MLEHVYKCFRDIVAVRDLCLEVNDQEFLVIVGPTGCGKTTLLELIAGLLKPDSGRIYMGDKVVNNLGPVDRGVRMVFEGYALYPHMKVYDEKRYSNLSFALKIRRQLSEDIRRIVEGVAEKVGIERRLFPRRPKELSAGEQQKVAVGRAITIKPKVLLLDEPLGHLDPQTRLRVRREIRELHKDLATTTIYVTHNLVDAMAVADRIAVMNHGEILQIDTPTRIYNNPKNEFVADFIRCFDLMYTEADRWKRQISA